MKWISARLAARFRNLLHCIAAATLLCLLDCPGALAAEAPGAPGGGSNWTTGAKQGLGTSATDDSKVWYTLAQGVLTEVYYPLVDTPNVQDLQFIISDGRTFVDLERDSTDHKVELVDPRALTYQQINTAKSGVYKITKTFITDPSRPTLLIQTRFQALSGGPYKLYVLYNPSLNNTGTNDTGATSGKALVASDGNIASALCCSSGFLKMSSGYSTTSSDGLTDIRNNKDLTAQFDSASTPGNLVQTGQINVSSDTTFILALGYGSTRNEAANNANDSLKSNFATLQTSYQQGWHAYLDKLKPPPRSVTSKGLTTQYNVALMALKAHADKTFPGAHVASLTNPWGDTVSADTPQPGYHRVWSRDLYEAATAQIAAGDKDSAIASLHYLLDKQLIRQPTPSAGPVLQPGAFPRFSKVDGTDLGCCEQLDEDAFPIILAWQLDQKDQTTWQSLKLIADHIVGQGAGTPAERWEEQSGLSPSTLAAEIAGLICAADIARANGDNVSATRYESVADGWQRSIESWTYTTNGFFDDHQYYERIDASGNPNDNYQVHFQDGEAFWEHDVVDAGFLEFVRLGVKPANDPKIARSLEVVDQVIKVNTPNGEMWHRYNHDCYGENDQTGRGWPIANPGRGRLWPILTGERGEYELANGRTDSALVRLVTMAKAGNEGFLIPEQCWDRNDAFGFIFGEGTGSATPLAWSMAQFVRLANSIDAGCPVETPGIVAGRYGANCPLKTGTIVFTVTVPAGTDTTGKLVCLTGELNKLDPSLPLWNPAGVQLIRVDPTHWQVKLKGTQGTQVQYQYTLGDWSFAEKGPGCAGVLNRTLTVNFDATGTMTVNDGVASWRNIPPCGN